MSKPGNYREKKAFFDKVLTVYGRKPVLEALQDDSLSCYRLHLADSNRAAPILDDIESLARQRGAEVRHHDRKALSRISRNGKQDQGVAADILCPRFRSLDEMLAEEPDGPQRVLALDGVTNPANAGMIVRSALAGGINAILWPDKGTAELGPLAIKASAGTLFRAPIVRCGQLPDALKALQGRGYLVLVMDAEGDVIGESALDSSRVYVLGNESEGISTEVAAVADQRLAIPMDNQVESLNVAVTAALICYLDR